MDSIEQVMKGLTSGTEVVPTAQIAAWLAKVASGEWTWVRNTRCKYVTLRIDTRRGAYLVKDRDDQPLTANELEWQYSAECPSPEVRARLLSSGGEG